MMFALGVVVGILLEISYKHVRTLSPTAIVKKIYPDQGQIIETKSVLEEVMESQNA